MDQTFSKKQKLIFVIITFCIALVFVILYYKLSEHKFLNYITYGLISIIANLIYIFIIFYFNKDKFIKALGGTYSIAIVYIFTLIVPFSIYFVIGSLILSGNQIPFEY